MGYEDRRYDEGRSSDDSGIVAKFRRYFQTRAGFFSWSLPLFTVPQRVPGLGGIRVRIHLLYILVIVGELLGAGDRGSAGYAFAAAMMGTLFLLVLLHEFGHCLACRLVGGQADDVLMWPLGGLAYCQPPMRWKPALITTLAGPGVNLSLLPVFAAALLLTGSGWSEVVFNPLRPNVAFAGYGHAWLWSAHYMNLVLLVFNMLVPMFPMDAGRVLQEVLWWRIGYKRSMVIAVNLGLGVAIALGVFGIATGQMRLISLALFGGFTCWNERRNLTMMEDQPAWAFDTDKGYGGFENDASDRPTKAARKAQQQEEKRRANERESRAKVDAILDKIQAHGVQSLSQAEKNTLKAATEKQRRGL